MARGRHTRGSGPYDPADPELYPLYDYAAPPREAAPPPEERVTAPPPGLRRQRLSALSVLGVLCAAALAVLSLLGRAALTEAADACAQLESRIEALEDEQARLRIAYESAWDLAELEAYATGELGMVRPGPAQIRYMETDTADRAVILRPAQEEAGLVDRVSDFLARLTAYFTGGGA